MTYVKPKKKLGQHFLTDHGIAQEIVDAYWSSARNIHTLEIGSGTGVLSDKLITLNHHSTLVLMDLDKESTDYLAKKYDSTSASIQHADFLKEPLEKYFSKERFGIIGNFPYNISSQIFFKVLEYKNQIPLVVGMLQKEVAERIAAKEGSKAYGILSVFLQAYYDIEYLFTVPPEVFDPPPKVQSGVIRLRRNNLERLACNEKLFARVVKTAFQTRRKTLRNALKGLNLPNSITTNELMNQRAEQLSVEQFVDLTARIESHD